MNRHCQFRLRDGYTPCPAERRAGRVEVAPGKRLPACRAHLVMKETQGFPVFFSDKSFGGAYALDAQSEEACADDAEPRAGAR